MEIVAIWINRFLFYQFFKSFSVFRIGIMLCPILLLFYQKEVTVSINQRRNRGGENPEIFGCSQSRCSRALGQIEA